MAPELLSRLRKICLALPEAHEVTAWGEPTFRVHNRMFAMHASADRTHGRRRSSIWIKATSGNQEFMLKEEPDRYFKPPYVGATGWVGVWIDTRTDWKELALLLRDGYLLLAPRRLLPLHDPDAARTHWRALARRS